MLTDSDSDSDCKTDACPVSITITDCDGPDIKYLAPPALDECAHLENFAFRDSTESSVLATTPQQFSLGNDATSPLSSGSTILPEPNRSCHCASTENTADQHKNQFNVNWDPFDYAKRYARDNMGEELNSPSARFWRMCLDETTTDHRNLLKELNGRTGDGVLIFAGLFCTVLSTFIVQIWPSLEVQTDYGQVTAILTLEMLQVQRAIAEGRSTRDIPSSSISATQQPSVPCSVKWILSLWLVSLTLSLTTAFIALLGRQWLHAQTETLSGSARDRARIRHSRYMALVRWRVPEILLCLPTTLHASVALFFVGLIIDLARRLNLGVAYFIAAIVGVTFLLYAVATMILPFFFPQCPYGTPFTYLVYRAFHTVRSTLRRDREHNIDAAHLDELDGATISWIYDSTSNPSVKLITLEAISGLRVGFKGRIEVRMSIVGDLLREVRSACSQGDVYKLELLARAYVQMQECAARGQVVSRDDDDDWSDGHIISSLERLRCPGTPQLDAALCCVGYYPSIDVTRKLYDITVSPNRSTLRLHPIIWLRQLTKAHASSHSTIDFLLATEMLNILTSVDFFDTQQFIAASDAPTTTLSEPTIEMAFAMVEYIHRASSSRETRTQTSGQSACNSTAALLAYVQQVARLLLDDGKGRDIVDFDALEHARNAVRYAIARESKASFTQSRTYHAAYGDALLGIASSEHFQKSDFGDVRFLLGSILSELHGMLVDNSQTTFPAFNLGDSNADCSNASFQSFGINLFQYILSYNVGCNQASECDVWEIASHLFDRGSPFIFEAFMQMDGLANLYHIFRAGLQSAEAPSATQLALAYLSGVLKSSQKSLVSTLESEFLYLHSEENLFPLVVMILYEERQEELLELIAVAPARFTSIAWSSCVLDLLNWTLEDDLCTWPCEKRRFARETIEKLYNMFSLGFCLPDDGIVTEYGFLCNGDLTGCRDARSASRLPGASRARGEEAPIPCVGPVSKIWSDSYENRLCAVSSAFWSTARPASERVNEWFRAVTAGNTDCLDSLLEMMEESNKSDSVSVQTVTAWDMHTHDALKNTEGVS